MKVESESESTRYLFYFVIYSTKIPDRIYWTRTIFATIIQFTHSSLFFSSVVFSKDLFMRLSVLCACRWCVGTPVYLQLITVYPRVSIKKSLHNITTFVHSNIQHHHIIISKNYMRSRDGGYEYRFHQNK